MVYIWTLMTITGKNIYDRKPFKMIYLHCAMWFIAKIRNYRICLLFRLHNLFLNNLKYVYRY